MYAVTICGSAVHQVPAHAYQRQTGSKGVFQGVRRREEIPTAGELQCCVRNHSQEAEQLHRHRDQETRQRLCDGQRVCFHPAAHLKLVQAAQGRVHPGHCRPQRLHPCCGCREMPRPVEGQVPVQTRVLLLIVFPCGRHERLGCRYQHFVHDTYREKVFVDFDRLCSDMLRK